MTIIDTPFRYYLSLSSVLFFGPLIGGKINTYNTLLSDEDKRFIRSYIPLGTFLNIVSIGGLIASQVLDTGGYRGVLINTILPCIIISIILIATWNIITNKERKRSYIIPSWQGYHPEVTQGNRTTILKNFLPGRSIWQRFAYNHYHHQYRWTKEAMIRRTIWALQHIMLGSTIVSIIGSMVIIARAATLFGGFDFIPNYYKVIISRYVIITPLDSIKGIVNTLSGLFGHTKNIYYNQPLSSILSNQSPRPRTRWIPHALGICCFVRLFWTGYMAITNQLWSVRTHTEILAYGIIILHPLGMIYAGLWIPFIHTIPSTIVGWIHSLTEKK